jgi:Protein of unknown function (DUF3040)
MGLPASEQLVLDRIEDQLKTVDPQLSSAFAAFTSVTSKAGLPAIEQLGSRRSTGFPGCRRNGKRDRPFLLRLAMLFVTGALLAVGMVAGLSGGRQTRCPVSSWSRAATAGASGVQQAGPASHGCTPASPEKTQRSRH